MQTCKELECITMLYTLSLFVTSFEPTAFVLGTDNYYALSLPATNTALLLVGDSARLMFFDALLNTACFRRN
jgi:hypothetical protein